jgi:class 3 adenylate cyclase
MVRVEGRVAAILDADVVGHSRLAANDENGEGAQLAHRRVEYLEAALARHGGRLVQLKSDGARAEFPCAVEALGAAIEFQQAMAEVNRGQSPETAVAFRLGLHLDDAGRPDGEASARGSAGGIVVSAPLRDAVAGRVKASFAELGSSGLGTVDQPVRAYEVGWDPADWPAASAAVAVPLAARRDGKRLSRWVLALGWLLLLMGVLYLAMGPRPQPVAAGSEAFDRLQHERLADAAFTRWQAQDDGEQDGIDDQPANPDHAQPVDAFDGLYAGTATTREDTRVVSFKVKVTNGVGAGTQSRLDCGTAPLSLRISPVGDVSGMVLMFGPTCLKTELAIRGRAVGGILQLRLGSQYLELSKPTD